MRNPVAAQAMNAILPQRQAEQHDRAPAPSGEQFEIVYGEQRATIVEVGGGIREYEVAGRAVLDPYGVDAMLRRRPRYAADPVAEQAGRRPLQLRRVGAPAGVDRAGARERDPRLFALGAVAGARARAQHVVMGARIHPQTGFPFALALRVAYSLDGDGLRWRRPRTTWASLPVLMAPASIPISRQAGDDRRMHASAPGGDAPDRR